MEQRDDFREVFKQQDLPEIPIHLEDKIMASIDMQSSLSTRRMPTFSMNLKLFSLSLFLLSVLSLFQFFTQLDMPILFEAKQIALLSTGIFCSLWLVEVVDSFISSGRSIASSNSRLLSL